MTDTAATTGVASDPAAVGKATPIFQPQDDWVLLSQGAEARIWKIPGNNDNDNSTQQSQKPSIAKERFSKSYRHAALDEKLTKSRCKAEGRILEKCRNPKDATLALDVPQVLKTQAPVLYLEFIEGLTVREYLEEHALIQLDNNIDNDDKKAPDNEIAKTLHLLAQEMGTMVGKLHTLGCIHGDLTTSNMMVRQPQALLQQNYTNNGQPDTKRSKTTANSDDTTTTNTNKITLIDFGLAKSTTSAEERAVDLYVLERALTSTHPKLPPSFMDTILQAYRPIVQPKKAADAALDRLEQVRLRGRKRECFG